MGAYLRRRRVVIFFAILFVSPFWRLLDTV